MHVLAHSRPTMLAIVAGELLQSKSVNISNRSTAVRPRNGLCPDSIINATTLRPPSLLCSPSPSPHLPAGAAAAAQARPAAREVTPPLRTWSDRTARYLPRQRA